ncbi:MAG: carboxypeptidase regulatory-like domain-containing protein [Planctomycetota bacterium]
MTRRRWILFGLAAGLCVALYVYRSTRQWGTEGFPETPWRLPREFEGVVLADGKPVGGAWVRLFEDERGGFFEDTETAADGSFHVTWTPTATSDPRKLFLVAGDSHTVVAARAPFTTLHLAPAVPCRGRVVTLDGTPVAGARVHAAPRHGPTAPRTATTGDDGRFTLTGSVPQGAPLDVLVRADGHATRLEGRFAGGDELTLHLTPGYPVTLRLRDPQGRAPPAARAWLPAPRAFAPETRPFATGRVTLADASDGGLAFVGVEAKGFLPLETVAWPGPENEVVLWPAREVEVLAWDAWNARGVEGVSLQIDLQPPEDEDWWGRAAGKQDRPVPMRVGRAPGIYRVRLPTCPVKLHLAAPGYGDASVEIGAGARKATARLQPPRAREKPGLLVLRAPPETPDLDLIVADPQGRWLRRVALEEGRAKVRVIPRRRLQIASAFAAEGIWIPRHKVDAFQPGERRAVRLGARQALRLRVAVEPVVAGEVELFDVEHEEIVPPRRAALAAGRAEFWVRPFRKLRVKVTPPGRFFAKEGEIETAAQDLTWTARLRRAAQLRYRIRDRAGHPLPFARVRLWEPARSGRIDLRTAPRLARADARGEVSFPGLRGGAAAVEVAAWGFRTRRFALVRLEPAKLHDGGGVTLEPAAVLRGRVVTQARAPVPGAPVRVLAPRVARLPMPGGGERDLYDLAESSVGDAVTGPDGTFEVRNAAPRLPLVAVYPKADAGYAAMAFEPAAELALHEPAYVELEVPGSVQGVYLLLGSVKAVLIKTDPPMSLRPLPLVVPAGKRSLFIRLRDGRWAAPVLTLKPGAKIRLTPEFR